MDKKKIIVKVPVPKAFDQLEAIYDTYYNMYNSIYDKNGYLYDVSTASQSNQKLYDICLRMINIINDNRENFEPIKKIDLFDHIEKILCDWKKVLEDNNTILYFRKCINWIRKKDPEDDSYFL
jgi:hypothetical protein